MEGKLVRAAWRSASTYLGPTSKKFEFLLRQLNPWPCPSKGGGAFLFVVLGGWLGVFVTVDCHVDEENQMPWYTPSFLQV